MRLRLMPGDVFCSSAPWVLGKLIKGTQRILSTSDRTEFDQTGIITDTHGMTLERYWITIHSHLQKYENCHLLIARPKLTLHGNAIYPEDTVLTIETIEKEYSGLWQQNWCCFLNKIPPLAKFSSRKERLDCSELVAKYLALLGARGENCKGVGPDLLADEWRRWKNFEIIYDSALMLDQEAPVPAGMCS